MSAGLIVTVLAVVALALFVLATWLFLTLDLPKDAVPDMCPISKPVEPIEEAPPVLHLSKFRAPKITDAQLPECSDDLCQCKANRLVWVRDEDSWIGICRRCGDPRMRAPFDGWVRQSDFGGKHVQIQG